MNGHYAKRAAAAALLVAAVVACSPTASPSPGPGGTGAPASDAATAPDAWRFANVVQPDAVTQAPSLQPGYHCSPCHPSAASQLFGVSPTASGALAVGVQQPPAVAIAVATSDGQAWQPVAWDPGEATTAIAVASAGPTTVVVGSGPDGAAAWLLRDGTWTRGTGGALAGQRGSTAMTAVVPLDAGFVAGGYRDDPLHLAASAAAWRSADGRAWQTDGDGSVFAAGRIDGMATRNGVVVAVGTAGDPTYGPAAAWVREGGTWRRSTIDDPGGGMHAVTATDDGFIAVGQNADDTGAKVWRSADGATWTAEPHQTSLDAGGRPIRMLSVASDGHEVVAGGWTSDAANGSSAAWTSTDGFTWERSPWVPVFSGGQIRGVVMTGRSVLGIGRSGYPDNNQAAAWVRPLP
jgi:hypothetical protein